MKHRVYTKVDVYSAVIMAQPLRKLTSNSYVDYWTTTGDCHLMVSITGMHIIQRGTLMQVNLNGDEPLFTIRFIGIPQFDLDGCATLSLHTGQISMPETRPLMTFVGGWGFKAGELPSPHSTVLLLIYGRVTICSVVTVTAWDCLTAALQTAVCIMSTTEPLKPRRRAGRWKRKIRVEISLCSIRFANVLTPTGCRREMWWDLCWTLYSKFP